MKKMEALLVDWRALEPQAVRLSKIKTHPGLQPRNIDHAPYDQRARLRNEAEQHVSSMHAALKHGELEPVLLAEVDGKLLMVDGHHRLHAYKRARREAIPARTAKVDLRTAHTVSKLVNCDFGKLPMQADQSRESAWQFIAAVTHCGRLTLQAAGYSVRTIADTFQISNGTAQAMTKRMAELNLSDFTPAACDPASGFPYWKYVKRNANPWTSEDVSDDSKDVRRAEKLGQMIARDGLDALVRSIKLLEIDALTQAAERLVIAAGDCDSDY